MKTKTFNRKQAKEVVFILILLLFIISFFA